MKDNVFPMICHRPKVAQFVAGNLGGLFLALIVFLLAGFDGLLPSVLFPFIMCAFAFICIILLCRYLQLTRMKFIISDEQMRYEYGILSLKCDYIELYRVVDYSEQRTFVQQLLGLKTISIYSGDRTCPRLDIIGVPEDQNLIRTIRERVEYNKRMANIHEFTNIR